MPNSRQGPMNKAAIAEVWNETYLEIESFFLSMEESAFVNQRDGKWSFAQNLDHLLRAVSPVLRALKMPKLFLRVLFGKGTTFRSYEEIAHDYKAKLNSGAKAPRGYIPMKLESRDVMIGKWVAIGGDLVKTLESWSEEQLDIIRLPHPILGRLTVREMMYFTDLHARHHLENCRE